MASETIAIEAIIGEHSSLIGWSAENLLLYHRFNVNLLAVSRKNERLDRKLGSVICGSATSLSCKAARRHCLSSFGSSGSCRLPSGRFSSAALSVALFLCLYCLRRWEQQLLALYLFGSFLRSGRGHGTLPSNPSSGNICGHGWAYPSRCSQH